jgi:Zn-dependent protease
MPHEGRQMALAKTCRAHLLERMLGWSMNLFRVRGIQLAVHYSFFLLLAYVAWEGWLAEAWPGALVSVALIVAFFACVVLHELGHSFVARRNGIRVPRILVMPIGGMAEFESIPREPRTEIAIALAGPAVNFVLVALLWWFVDFSADTEATALPQNVGDFINQLFLANLVMGTFNLLPVFPMDGGRVLRALLALRLPYLRATFVAAAIGKVLALLLAIAALWFEAYLAAVLFLFIFVVGEAEYRAVKRAEIEAARWRDFWARVNLSPAPPAAEPPTPIGPEPPVLLG